MDKKDDNSSPIQSIISFDTLLKYYDALALSNDSFLVAKAKRVLDAQAPYPELREGFTDVSLLKKYKKIISIILEDTFSDVLGKNEIKTASIPYNDLMFNSTERFKKIIKDAGPNFKPTIRNLQDETNYMMGAVLVLNFFYGFKVHISRPYFYDIPDAEGIMHHYRILHNGDFLELIPTTKTKKLTQDDVDLLLANFDDIKLWKEKIPPNSFIAKGFVVLNMVDVTDEQTISDMKSAMISGKISSEEDSFVDNLQETFRSFFRLKSITVGFVIYNKTKNQFESGLDNPMGSIILGSHHHVSCESALCPGSYKALMQDNTFFTVTDVHKYFDLSGGIAPYKNLKEAGYQSAIFAPIANNDILLGVLEIGSPNINELNSVVATKLEEIMPFLVASVLRASSEEANLIDAVIQNECTSVHHSVYWKFEEEARNFIRKSRQGEEKPTFNEIVFENVYPLYGQIDIKDSSNARNVAIQRDLIIQLTSIIEVLQVALDHTKLFIYEELIYRSSNHLSEISTGLDTNSEQIIIHFVIDEINPVLEHLKKEVGELTPFIEKYEKYIDAKTHSYYDHRKNYDDSVMAINEKLALLIDKKQESAQQIFPHYFERYKTDGIEHNMYIGAQLAQHHKFSSIFLKNLRLWQLQVMCEMENAHYHLKTKLPVKLDVASLVLVFNTSLSIRFRMDEKRFDVDGTYNARYEVIKKRIDKSLVKGTQERLTQAGKMAIVYSQKSDEQEYLGYISFLKSKGYFTDEIEIVALEGLQGVEGLKAIRVPILYKKNEVSKKSYTYQDLMETLED